MAKEPVDMTLHLLREIRAVQDKHTEMHEQHRRDFEAIRQELRDWQETSATSAGYSVHANLRVEGLEKKVNDLLRRVEELESAR